MFIATFFVEAARMSISLQEDKGYNQPNKGKFIDPVLMLHGSTSTA